MMLLIYCGSQRCNEVWSSLSCSSSFVPSSLMSNVVLVNLLIIKFSFWWCDSWGSFRSHWRKANRRFAYANGKMQIVDLLFFCASWIFFRRNRNNDILNEFGRYIYKSGDYYIGEFKGGCRHEHGWLA